MQHRGDRIANRADYRVVRIGISVELVRRAKELVSLGHKHVADRQPGFAMCCRDGGGRYAVVYKPGTYKVEGILVRFDELGNLLFEKV